MRINVLSIFIIVSISAFASSLPISEHLYQIDIDKHLILINKDTNIFNNNISSIILGESEYTFINGISQPQTGKEYTVSSPTNKEFTLYFTKLPIVTITTNNTIIDEPSTYAQFTLSESNGNITTSNIGIEYRGGHTQSYPKKSFRIEFWNDTIGEDTQNFSLLNMRNDDDWNLQAMYNEPLRIRSKTNFEIWQMIDTLNYTPDEPEAINGVRQEFVELFLNGEYRGVYALSERVDRKQLKLKKTKDDLIQGELYKGIGWGASTYTSVPYFNNNGELWGGFQLKYPDDTIEWSSIYNFVDFVVNSDSAEFYKNYHKLFNIDNAVNYYIYLNLIHARDNTGKNLYVAKYTKEELYFYVPWDLDGTLGMLWNGDKDNVTDNILSNGFYDRLIKDNHINGFTEKLTKRWNELRKNIITKNRMMKMLETNFNYLNDNLVYERENLVWPDCQFTDSTNLDYTSFWLENRIKYLDKVFRNTDYLLPVNEPIINNKIIIYPNPATNFINIDIPFTNTDATYKIVNTQGSVEKQNTISDNQQIDISALPRGIFLIIINSNRKNYTERIVLQ